jgi:hypothetical protein
MLLKQPDKNQSAESTRQCKRDQQQRQNSRPVIRQNSALPKDECPDDQTEGRGGCRPADRRDVMFLDTWPAAGRTVDCGDAAEPGSVKILQYGPTGPRALKNANQQDAIAILLPMSHIRTYRIRFRNIDAIV